MCQNKGAVHKARDDGRYHAKRGLKHHKTAANRYIRVSGVDGTVDGDVYKRSLIG